MRTRPYWTILFLTPSSSFFHTLTQFAAVRCGPASLTRSLPIRFSPSRVVERETKKPRPCSCFFAIVVISDLSSFAIEGASCGAIPTIGNKGCEKGPGRVRHDGNLYRGVRCAAVGLVV